MWATWALFVGLALVMAGSGLIGTIIGIRAEAEGFPTGVIGLIGTAYYAGFLVGSRISLRALTKVGHIRVFTALASVLAVSVLMTGLKVQPAVWIVTEFVTGVCLAGQYVVAESWLNHLVENQSRGRLLAIYGIVTALAYGIGQYLVRWADPGQLSAFAVAAALVSIAVAPVALSEEADAPDVEEAEHMSLKGLAKEVPTSVGAMALIGLTNGALFGLIAVWAARNGLNTGQVGAFVAASTIGGVVLEYPLSSASDSIDRRAVGLAAAAMATAAAVLLVLSGPKGWVGIGLIAVVGGMGGPLYALTAAYANDLIPPETATAAASQLILLYGAGAMVGPLLSSATMAAFGNDGFMWTVVVLHVLLCVFFVYRLLASRSPLVSTDDDDMTFSARLLLIPMSAVLSGTRRVRNRRS